MTSTCSHNATTTLACLCTPHLSHSSQLLSLYIFRSRCSSCSPSFIISFVHQLYSYRTKISKLPSGGMAWRSMDQHDTAGRSMEHLFLYLFLVFHFLNYYIFSDKMGLAWVWSVKGVFLVTISSTHHFIKTLRAAEGEKQTKSSVFLEEQKEDKGFLKKSGFENG